MLWEEWIHLTSPTHPSSACSSDGQLASPLGISSANPALNTANHPCLFSRAPGHPGAQEGNLRGYTIPPPRHGGQASPPPPSRPSLPSSRLLDSPGCCNKMPQTAGLKHSRLHPLVVLRQKPELRCGQGHALAQVPTEAPSCTSRGLWLLSASLLTVSLCFSFFLSQTFPCLSLKRHLSLDLGPLQII